MKRPIHQPYVGNVQQLPNHETARIKAQLRALVQEDKQAALEKVRRKSQIKILSTELAKAEGLLVYPSFESTIRRFGK